MRVLSAVAGAAGAVPFTFARATLTAVALPVLVALISLTALTASSCAPPEEPPPEQPRPPAGQDAVFPEPVGEGEGEAVGEGEGEGDGGQLPDPDERPEIDPAPGVEAPGEHSDGSDCPSTAPAESAIEAGAVTSFTFSGTVSGAAGNGAFYVRGRNEEEIAGEIPLSGGSYSITLPVFCGENVVKRVFSNDTCTYVLVTTVTTSGCVDADLRTTLVWDDLGRDWELHLVKPGGTINDNATDCTWTSCVNGSPEWGAAGAADNPRKDVDHLGQYGPENILLDGLEEGVYTVLVEHWSSSGSAQSDGTLIINMADKLVVVDIIDLAPMEVWTAARIHWPSGEVETFQDVHDCSANWSGGCRDALPVAPDP